MAEKIFGHKGIYMNISIIGLGYWGPNLLRTFNNLGVVKYAHDLDKNKIDKFKDNPLYRDVIFNTEYLTSIYDPKIDAVVVATPPHTHYEIATKALYAGKHVFIEKPMTLSVYESEEIVKIANKNNLVVMVGHIFLYSPEIVKLKEIINSEDFGNIQYIYTKRLNLGKIQSPANVIEDLAPHDISILNYLLDGVCTEAQVIGKSHIIDTEDVAFVSLKYCNVLCHLHLSWLDPLKVRSTVVVGSKKMAVCDSIEKNIYLYDKGVDVEEQEGKMSDSYSNYVMTYRYGDVLIPKIDNYEPMVEECKDFINCIGTGKKPKASGEMGLEVVKTLNAITGSLKRGGTWETI